MNKIYPLLFFLFIFIQNPSYAEQCFTCIDIQETPYSFSTLLTKITGIDYLKLKSAEFAAEQYIYKKFNNKVEIKIKAKSSKAFLNGEFQKISAKSENFQYKFVSVSKFNAQTLCPYNKFILKNNNYFFPYDIPMEFSAEITNDDLSYMLQSQVLKQEYKLLKICTLDWYIENSKIIVCVVFKSPFTLGIPIKITFSSKITTEDGKVKMLPENIGFLNQDVNKFLPYLINYNPLSYVIDNASKSNVHIEITNLALENNKIFVKGLFIIPANCDITK